MTKFIRLIVVIPAVILLVTAVRLVIEPGAAVESLGMPLLDAQARSTQLGDLTAFFFTASLSALIGISTEQRFWFYPAAMLTGLTALFRLLAWLLHDAALTTQFIVMEMVFCSLFLLAARQIGRDS
jgi:hypothetical protein